MSIRDMRQMCSDQLAEEWDKHNTKSKGDNMPNINIEYTEKDVMRLILQDLNEKMPGFNFNEEHLKIKVKSKQNYRSHEWETGQLQITVDSNNYF